MRQWSRLLIWVLVLHTVHAPVPVPDLDGECRGIPIHSLVDSRAWHPVLLGIRPNDDVDRGPIRTSNDRESTFDGSQFGDLAIRSGRPAHVAAPISATVPGWLPTRQSIQILAPIVPSGPRAQFRRWISSRTVSIDFCVWRI